MFHKERSTASGKDGVRGQLSKNSQADGSSLPRPDLPSRIPSEFPWGQTFRSSEDYAVFLALVFLDVQSCSSCLKRPRLAVAFSPGLFFSFMFFPDWFLFFFFRPQLLLLGKAFSGFREGVFWSLRWVLLYFGLCFGGVPFRL